MAQFQQVDIAGALNRGLQFRQQNELRPMEIALAQQNVARGQQQFAQGEQNLEIGKQTHQFNQTKQRELEQTIDQRTAQQKNLSLLNVAMRVQNAPDEQIIPILQEQIAMVGGIKDADATESVKALELAEQGRFDEVREGAKNLVNIGIAQGDIKAPEKQTASKSDFDTYKALLAKAKKSGDQKDQVLADKFGVQAGFDRLSPEELANVDIDKEMQKALNKQAIAVSKESFDSLKLVTRSVNNMENALKALGKGADTGVIMDLLPSFTDASIELDNIKGRMGLDVISSVTFGALSESELKFALDTALPTKLDPSSLRKWLNERIEPQKKNGQ